MPTEFELLILKMDTGFDKVYLKMDALRKDFGNQVPMCMDKFAVLDRRFSVREAVNRNEEKYEKERRDWGLWFVRGTLAVISIGALTLLWKLLIGDVKIIGG